MAIEVITMADRGDHDAAILVITIGRHTHAGPELRDVTKKNTRKKALASVSREYGVTAAKLSEWNKEFLAAGEAARRDSRAYLGPRKTT